MVNADGATTQAWLVYDVPSGKIPNFDFCNDVSFTAEEGIDPDKFTDKFPTNIGTFSLSGLSDCIYTAPDSNTLGKIACTGSDVVAYIQCLAVAEPQALVEICPVPLKATSEEWLPILTCAYAPPSD